MTGPTSFNAFSSGSPAGGQPTNPTLTPQAIERRQALAAALMKEGSDYSPIQSPWQGVARVAAAISGGLQQHWADEDYSNSLAASAKRNSDLLSQIWGGGYSPGTGASAAGGSGTPSASNVGNTGDIGVNLPPDGLAKHAFDYFVGKGYTPAAAAGLIGNFQQESGFSPGNIAAASGGGDGGMSKHLAQWNGDRLTGLQNFAAKLGKSPSDYDTQLAYVDWELNNTEKATGDALKGVTDPGQAAYIAAGYERPQGWKQGGSAALINGWKNRLAYANQAYGQWGNGGQVAQAAPPQQAPANQVASADPNFVPQTPQTAPQQAIPLPPVDPRTQAAGQQQFAPNSLTGAQAEQLANQGQTVPMSAVQNPPDTPDSAPAGAQPMTAASSAPEMASMGLRPMAVANGGPLPSQPPTTGAHAVTNAMVAPGAPPAASAQPNLTDGGQKVAQALAPAAPIAQPGVPANVLGAYAQMMADPWTAPEVKQQMGAMLASRMRPVDYGFQTLPDGTIVRTDPRNGTVTPIFRGPQKPMEVNGRLVTPDGKLIADYSNPQTATVGNAVIDTRTGKPIYQAPPNYGFQEVNGHLVATNPQQGTAADVTPPGVPSGYRPATEQERAAYNVAPGMPLYFGPDGKPTSLGPQTSVSVNNGENSFDKTVGEGQGKMFLGLVEDGQQAQTDLANIGNLRGALANTPGGMLGGLQAMANSYGIKLGDNASSVEYASSLIDKLTPQQRQGMPGAASDRDVAMFKNALPKMGNTPEGNTLILNTMQGLAQQRIKRAEIATAVTTGQMSRQDGMKALQSLPDPFAEFRKAMEGQQPAPTSDVAPQPEARPGAVIPPSQHGPAQRGVPKGISPEDAVPVQRPADTESLPTGAYFKTPDGRIMRKK